MALELTGSQARGKAGVFGTPTSPLGIYLQFQANRQKRYDDLYDHDRKQRDDVIKELRQFNPDKVWEPFYDEVNRDVQANVRDKFHQLSNEGVPIAAIDHSLQRARGDVNTRVNKINWLRTQFDDAGKEIDNNPMYLQNETHRALNDVFFDGRVARPSETIDAGAIRNSVFDNVDNFNHNNIAIEFMKSLPLKVNQEYTEMFNNLGQQYNIQETEGKLGYARDAQGRHIMDPRTGLPKVSMTDDVYLQAVKNPYLQKVLERYVPQGDIPTQKAFLTQYLEGYDPQKIQNRPQLGFKTPEDERDRKLFQRFGITFGHKVADLEARRDWLDGVVTKRTPELLSAISNSIGDVKLEYVKTADGKDAIRVNYPSGALDENATEADFQNRLLGGPGKRKESIDILIGNEKLNREAELKLSNVIDKLNPKQSIGSDEYVRYTEAWRKNNKKQTGAFDDF